MNKHKFYNKEGEVYYVDVEKIGGYLSPEHALDCPICRTGHAQEYDAWREGWLKEIKRDEN